MTRTPAVVAVPSRRPGSCGPCRVVVLAGAYAALVAFGVGGSAAGGPASPLAPAAGLALAAMVLWGPRYCPALVFGQLAAHAYVATGRPLWVDASIAIGQAAGPVLAAWLLRRLDFSVALARARDAYALLAVGVVGASAVGATIATATLAAWLAQAGEAIRPMWTGWFLRDAVGVLTVAPLVFVAFRGHEPRPAAWWLELAACTGAAVAAAWLVFVHDDPRFTVSWYTLVPLLWAALRFHDRAAVVIALTAALAAWATVAGRGPFGDEPSSAVAVLQLQQYLAIATVTTLILAALARERREVQPLQAARQRLRLALSAGRMGVWTYRPDTGEADWDTQLGRLIGLPAHELAAGARGPAFFARIHPDDLPRARENLQRALRDQGSFADEFRFLRPDGGVVWLATHGTVVAASRGQPLQLIGVNFDVSDRKAAELALRDSELQGRRRLQELDTVYRTATVAMALADPQGRLLRVNRELAALTARPIEWHGGRTLHEIAPAIAGALEPHRLAALRTGHPVTGVEIAAEAPARPGARRTWRVSCTPLVDGDGHIDAVSLVLVEVTDLLRAQAALQAADRRKDEFLATLAHELRNPLAPLRTGLSVLRRVPCDSPAAQATQEMMERQLARTLRLVDDLLDVSRISRGKVTLRRRRVDLAQVVRAAVEASRPAIDAGRHRFRVDEPAGPVVLLADTDRLAQVLANLLTNAAKYTPPGGHVALRAWRDGAFARITVTDTGVGIAPGMLPRIFDLFTQVDPAEDRSQGGLGIGLSLVKRFVEMHGGTVQAHSDGPGRGSRFEVHLPVAADREPDPSPQAPPATDPAA